MGAIVALSAIFFFLLNFLFGLTFIFEGWEWKDLVLLSVIDFFFVLLVCVGLFVVSIL